MDGALIVEVLVAGGFFTAVSETVRWFLGRGRTKVDQVKIVQGMTLDLLKPLHAELARANARVADLQRKIAESDRALSEVILYAIGAKRLLGEHGISYDMHEPEVLREHNGVG